MQARAQTEDLLARVRRYALPEEACSASSVWLRQKGEMRLAPGRPWMPFHAEQWFSGPGIDFRWQAKFRMAPFLPARVVDAYLRGHGQLRVTLFGILPVASSRGAACDQAEAQRGLAELPWRPYAFGKAENCTWQAIDAETLRAVFDNGTTSATVDFQVNCEGRVLGAHVASRPRAVGNQTVDTPWSGVFGKYRKFGRVLIPATAEALWHLPDGPFPCWRAQVVDFRLHSENARPGPSGV